MLKKEQILASLGMDEAKATELGLDFTGLIKVAQELGDGIATKGKTELATMQAELDKLKNASQTANSNENSNSNVITLADLNNLKSEMMKEFEAKEQEKQNAKSIANFKQRAKKSGYNDEQIEKITASMKAESLDDFDLSLFGKKIEDDFGDKKKNGGDNEVIDAELEKLLRK